MHIEQNICFDSRIMSHSLLLNAVAWADTNLRELFRAKHELIPADILFSFFHKLDAFQVIIKMSYLNSIKFLAPLNVICCPSIKRILIWSEFHNETVRCIGFRLPPLTAILSIRTPMTTDSMTSHRTIQHSIFFDWPIAQCVLVMLFSYRYSAHQVVRFVVSSQFTNSVNTNNIKKYGCFDIFDSRHWNKKKRKKREKVIGRDNNK